MNIDLQSAHCELFSLHSHFPPGEPARDLLVSACGSEFSKRGKAEGKYSISGRTYRVRVSVDRSAKFGTVIDITCDNLPKKSGKLKPSLDVEKLWKCLEKASKLPTWHCKAFFEYPSSGYDVKYRLPSPIDRPMEGFSEIRGVRLVRTIESKVLYSVILDRPDNTDIRCTVYFTIQKETFEALADDAFRKATEIVAFAVAPETRKD